MPRKRNGHEDEADERKSTKDMVGNHGQEGVGKKNSVGLYFPWIHFHGTLHITL
jgi:hypothetical protein